EPERASRGDAQRHLPGAGALDGGRQVRLVVDRASDPGHEGRGDELPNEDDAAPLPKPDVEAQVDLGEVAQARPGHAPDARAEEVEGDKARERSAPAPIKLEPRR